jgi:hypothetical protein
MLVECRVTPGHGFSSFTGRVDSFDSILDSFESCRVCMMSASIDFLCVTMVRRATPLILACRPPQTALAYE